MLLNKYVDWVELWGIAKEKIRERDDPFSKGVTKAKKILDLYDEHKININFDKCTLEVSAHNKISATFVFNCVERNKQDEIYHIISNGNLDLEDIRYFW